MSVMCTIFQLIFKADKQGHSDMRELLSEQAGLKRQIKTFRDGCAIDVLDIDVTSKEVVPTSVRRFSLGEIMHELLVRQTDFL